MHKKAQLEYVASALGFIKAFAWKDGTEESEAAVYFNRCLKTLQGRNGHKVSVLFNGYTERDLGRRIKDYLGEGAHDIYADSGGLQVVSRGFKVDANLRDRVYKTQAELSTVGMCFDRIPVDITHTVSNPNYINNRAFNPELVISAATETAENIRRQIDVYDQLGSKCRPIVIMQGNCYDSFQEWAQIIVKVLGSDYLKRCAGMALADTAHGIGMYDDIERMYIGSRLEIPNELNKHIHLLGIGRIRRLLPMVILARNGFFPHTENISYDSSTHTRQITIGYHFMDGKMVRFGTGGPLYDVVEHDIITKTRDLFGYEINPAVLKDVLIKGARITDRDSRDRKTSQQIIDLIKTCVSACLISIDNFNNCVHNCFDDKTLMNKAVLNSRHEFNALAEVKTNADFERWMAICGKRMRSQRVSRKSVNALDDFF